MLSNSSPSILYNTVALYQFDQSLKLASWNVNGWNENNKCIKEKIILELNIDTWILTGTHLKREDKTNVPGFKWVGQNRARAKNASGGLVFLILYEVYSMCLIILL